MELKKKIRPKAKIMISLRLDKESIEKLLQLSKHYKITQVEVIRQLIDLYSDTILPK